MFSSSYRQCAAVGELTASLQPISVQLLQSAQLLSGSTAVTKVMTEVSGDRVAAERSGHCSPSLFSAAGSLPAACSLRPR